MKAHRAKSIFHQFNGSLRNNNKVPVSINRLLNANLKQFQ